MVDHINCTTPWLTYWRLKSNQGNVLKVTSGIIAVMTVPTAIYGVIGNLMLIICLAVAVRMPHRLEIWGALLSALNMLFLVIVAFLYTMLKVGAPWWSILAILPYEISHSHCKLLFGSMDFVITAQMNVILVTLTRETSMEATQLENKNLTYSWIAVILALSMIQTAPTFLISGMHINHGVPTCDTDPQWASTYQRFWKIHHVLFCDGLSQSVGAVLIIIISCRRLQMTNRVLAFLETTPPSASPVYALVYSSILDLSSKCRNLKVVLVQTTITVGIRMIRCLLRISHIMASDILCFEHLNLISMIEITTFSEAVAISFTFIWWYVNVLELQRFIRKHGNRFLLCLKSKDTNFDHSKVERSYLSTSIKDVCLSKFNSINLESDFSRLRKIRKQVVSNYEAQSLSMIYTY